MLLGYARVSTQDQDTTAQIAALRTAGCELIFQEKASGGRWDPSGGAIQTDVELFSAHCVTKCG